MKIFKGEWQKSSNTEGRKGNSVGKKAKARNVIQYFVPNNACGEDAGKKLRKEQKEELQTIHLEP